MSFARFRELTFDIFAVMWVENEILPLPVATDPEQERPPYFPITHARLAAYLTLARYHNDTAYAGSGDSVRSRSRCDSPSQAGIQPADRPSFMRHSACLESECLEGERSVIFMA